MRTTVVTDEQCATIAYQINTALKQRDVEMLHSLTKSIRTNFGGRAIDKDIYPDLTNLHFSNSDLASLIDKGVLAVGKRKKLQLTAKALLHVQESSDPLLKLLYVQCWKINGELAKTGNIADGVRDYSDGTKPSTPAVLYRLGRHISSKGKEPLIDQHNVRAFRYLSASIADRPSIRLQGLLTVKEQKYVELYATWYMALELDRSGKRAVDELLMALGQVLKLTSKASKKTARAAQLNEVSP